MKPRCLKILEPALGLNAILAVAIVSPAFLGLQGQSTQANSPSSPSTQALATGTQPVSATPAFRSAKAIQVLQSAIAKLGGLNAIRSVQSWTIEETETLPLDSISRKTKWEVAGGEMRSEITTDGATAVFTTGHGRAAVQASGGVKAIHVHVVRAIFIPAMTPGYLEQIFDNPYYAVDYLGTDSGGAETVLRTTSHATHMEQAVTPEIWYFDNATGLPSKVMYRIPTEADPNRYVLATATLGNFQSVGGVMIPFSATHSLGTQAFKVIQLSDVQMNQPIAQDAFEPLQVNQ